MNWTRMLLKQLLVRTSFSNILYNVHVDKYHSRADFVHQGWTQGECAGVVCITSYLLLKFVYLTSQLYYSQWCTPQQNSWICPCLCMMLVNLASATVFCPEQTSTDQNNSEKEYLDPDTLPLGFIIAHILVSSSSVTRAAT